MPFWKEFQLQISPKIIIITENLQSPSPFLYTCTYVQGISVVSQNISGKKSWVFFLFLKYYAMKII